MAGDHNHVSDKVTGNRTEGSGVVNGTTGHAVSSVIIVDCSGTDEIGDNVHIRQTLGIANSAAVNSRRRQLCENFVLNIRAVGGNGIIETGLRQSIPGRNGVGVQEITIIGACRGVGEFETNCAGDGIAVN